MITIPEVEQIHNLLIEEFGGSKGIRDRAGLEAALHRPFATFDQQELYPTAVEKAAAILESILINHPFLDGNKRTGYVLCRLFLLQEGLDINANQDQKYEMVISVSTGQRRFEEIRSWLEKHHKKAD